MDITRKAWLDWRWQLRNRVRDLRGFSRALGIDPGELDACRRAARAPRFAVTPYYLSLIDPDDPADPLRRQCLPDPAELAPSTGEARDPLGEGSHSPVPGLIHRYSDRCLVLATNVCAAYCRHCNRRRMWRAPEAALSAKHLRRVLDYVSAHGEIREVILSGGDPLTLGDGALGRLLRAFRAVPHVEVIRIGSRAPVVMPMRITRDFCQTVRPFRPLWFVTQFNHPREITPESARACERLQEAGIPVMNQSVLLRGVNDDFDAMLGLVHGLQRISVRPYYLFQCEPVKGTAHFRVDILKGMDIAERLRTSTAGLCLPRYVIDLPGRQGKLPLQ